MSTLHAVLGVVACLAVMACFVVGAWASYEQMRARQAMNEAIRRALVELRKSIDDQPDGLEPTHGTFLSGVDGHRGGLWVLPIATPDAGNSAPVHALAAAPQQSQSDQSEAFR